MTAHCIHYADDQATVVIRPSWIGYLFGSRVVSVDLQRTNGAWHTVATRRELRDLPHGSLIRNALDFREVGSEPRRALTGGTVAL